MRSYINNSLVHWTGRGKSDDEAFSILEKIINSRILLLSYCPNYTKLPESVATKTMMVCFTDLPLNLSAEHCKDFGCFGIGFSKEQMIIYGANPVLYTTKIQSERMKVFTNLLVKFAEFEKDREWKESPEEPYQFTTTEFEKFLEISGFLQEYEYDINRINYFQREWRINYQTLPITPGNSPQKPGDGGIHGMVGNKIMCEMLFAKEDVNYIVVKRDFEVRGRQLASTIGCELKIYEDEVK